MQETGVHKIYRRDNQPWAQIPNDAIRNPQITSNGFRLLAYLMSHQDGYELTYSQIERETGLGRYAINEAIKNLTGLGWLRTERTKMPNGQYGPKSWTVLTPTSASFSTVGDSTVEQPTDIKKTTNKEHNSKEETLAQSQIERLFLEFWQGYPRKVGKAAAFKAFKKLEFAEMNEAADGAERLANDPHLPPMQFVPHPATWLNREGWLDEPYPERQLTPGELKLREIAELAERKKREAEAQERERAERRRIEEEARLNPPEKCEHGKILVLGNCKQCR